MTQPSSDGQGVSLRILESAPLPQLPENAQFATAFSLQPILCHSSSDDSSDDRNTQNKFSGIDKNISEGFKYGTGEQLKNFLEKIVNSAPYHGICISHNLKLNDGQYRHGRRREFTIKKYLLKQTGDILLCEDNRTKILFVLKTVRSRVRLPGIEFLAKHYQPFLPSILGVYRCEDNTMYIFQEYIEGIMKYDETQLHVFMEHLLKAIEFLHAHDLVHFDIKADNIRFRVKSDPKTLVLVDFESAKHPEYSPCEMTGFTTKYLPPWHRLLEITIRNKKYSHALKSSDLWAASCIFILYLTTSDQNNMFDRRIWSRELKDIRNRCRNCRKTEETLLKTYLHEKGHLILQAHISRLLDAESHYQDRRYLQTQLDVLKYITLNRTSTDELNEVSASKALAILRGMIDHQEMQEIRDRWERSMEPSTPPLTLTMRNSLAIHDN